MSTPQITSIALLRSGASVYTVGFTDTGKIASIAFNDLRQKTETQDVILSLQYDSQGNPSELSERRIEHLVIDENDDRNNRDSTQHVIFKIGAECEPLTIRTQTITDPDPDSAIQGLDAGDVTPRAPDEGEVSHARHLLERFKPIHTWIMEKHIPTQIIPAPDGNHITSRGYDTSGAPVDWAVFLSYGALSYVGLHWPESGRSITAIFGNGQIAWLQERTGHEHHINFHEGIDLNAPGVKPTPEHEQMVQDVLGLAQRALLARQADTTMAPS